MVLKKVELKYYHHLRLQSKMVVEIKIQLKIVKIQKRDNTEHPDCFYLV